MPTRLTIPSFILALVVPGAAVRAGAEETAPTTRAIRVMTFNLRLGVADDGPNHWDRRKPLVVQTIRRFDPDLFGTQETFKFQADYLLSELEGYGFFGRSRQHEPHEGEHCGIFYRRTRFTWLAGGHFWLSETPEVPASKSWDSSLPRMASWVLLHDRDAPRRAVLFVNTHFDHRGRQARLESARLVRDRVEDLKQAAHEPHVLVTGDFNCPEGSAPYLALLENHELVDAYRAVHADRKENEGTFNAWTGVADGGRIDWILGGPSLRALDAEIDRWSLGGRYPSDHFPVTAVFAPQESGLDRN